MWKYLFIFILAMQPLTGYCESDTVEVAGDYTQIILPTAAIIMTMAHGDREGLTQWAKSEVAQFVTVHSLKRVVDAERPNGSAYSFPSGHTAQAFQSARFIHKRYGEACGWLLPATAYGLAAFTAWSRVEAEQHYWWDVVAGAVVGAAAAEYFTTNKMAVVPFAQHSGYGVMVSMRF